MRSNQVHLAIAQGNSRYEICRLTFKGVHIIHKRGERMEDSINRVLGMLRPVTPVAMLQLGVAANAAANPA